ncbi:hypothetical protein [Candidatus Entotheonella palauensis]|uniref:Uncharacterized protein n=1 Tax=Candidatus Entotheonella gemina TaxID=1429439 RepID=W4MH43_9BACT|nr:hypothetical protein [Candidatus Entotheonella palauensis]ETX09022.1 MAG: hypothetical protein ETSY2_01925 [Candidatus Entotheonella gemina]
MTFVFSWRQHSALDWAVGVQVNFFDFVPDLDYFAEAVLPLMVQAGLRNPCPAPR